jgi:hypothetical protein
MEESVPVLTVFVDARNAAASNGQAGVVVAAGLRVGQAAIEAILCDGVVEVTARTQDGTPLAVGRRRRVIPPQLRRLILDPENLTTVCWFHHQVVIHGHGSHIDPNSPPQTPPTPPPPRSTAHPGSNTPEPTA